MHLVTSSRLPGSCRSSHWFLSASCQSSRYSSIYPLTCASLAFIVERSGAITMLLPLLSRGQIRCYSFIAQLEQRMLSLMKVCAERFYARTSFTHHRTASLSVLLVCSVSRSHPVKYRPPSLSMFLLPLRAQWRPEPIESKTSGTIIEEENRTKSWDCYLSEACNLSTRVRV